MKEKRNESNKSPTVITLKISIIFRQNDNFNNIAETVTIKMSSLYALLTEFSFVINVAGTVKAIEQESLET